MSNLEKIELLLKYIDSDNPIHGSYKIIDGIFTHMHYGWKTTEIKQFPNDEDLKSIVDITIQHYANQMRVSKNLVASAFKT